MDEHAQTKVKALLLGMLREDSATKDSIIAEATKLCDGDEAMGWKLLAEVCESVVDRQPTEG